MFLIKGKVVGTASPSVKGKIYIKQDKNYYCISNSDGNCIKIDDKNYFSHQYNEAITKYVNTKD